MNNYKELKVWQKAMDLAERVYQLTAVFPKEEKFGLTSQMRRASVSVASNIAEGAGRNSKGEFRQMLGIAYGSVCELETQLILTQRMKMLSDKEYDNLSVDIVAVQKMLYGLMNKLT